MPPLGLFFSLLIAFFSFFVPLFLIHSCFYPCVLNRLRDENKSARWHAFRSYSEAKHGYLGKGNRKPHPACIEKGVRAVFPDPDGQYVGFRPAANMVQQAALEEVETSGPTDN